MLDRLLFCTQTHQTRLSSLVLLMCLGSHLLLEGDYLIEAPVTIVLMLHWVGAHPRLGRLRLGREKTERLLISILTVYPCVESAMDREVLCLHIVHVATSVDI